MMPLRKEQVTSKKIETPRLLKVSGVACDNENCDYVNKNVQLGDFTQYLNKPCPKCGEILLTKEDYDISVGLVTAFQELADLLNQLDDKSQIEKATKELEIKLNSLNPSIH